MKLIFSIEDEPSIVSLLEYNITSSGFKFDHSLTAYDGMLKIQEKKPDLVLLDWMLPDLDGTEVCKFIRKNAVLQKIPIIMLTAKGEEDNMINGLEYGADDYIIKPFSPKELIARINALLRRASQPNSKSKLSYGNILMDTDMHRVYCCDKETKLGPREYRILEFFLQNPGRVYSRQQILDAVWGTNVYITYRTIYVHIRRLRKALSVFEECYVIRTIRSSGYSLDSKS